MKWDRLRKAMAMVSSHLQERASSRASSPRSNKRCSLASSLKLAVKDIETFKCRAVPPKSSSRRTSPRVKLKAWCTHNNKHLWTTTLPNIIIKVQHSLAQKDQISSSSPPATSLLVMRVRLLLIMRGILSAAQPTKALVVARQST